MAFEDKEQFRVLFLDKKNRLIADEVQQRGTVDHTLVYPREVIKRALERNIASLEDGLDGHAFASGMAAISSVMTMVPADHHVVASRTVYGGTYRLFEQVLDRYRLRVSWVDARDLDAVAGALRAETRLVFLESPTNPLMVGSAHPAFP